MRVVAVPITGEKPSGAVIIFQDLTEVRSLQNMRRDFIASISHDLRTPLTNMRAITDTLKGGAIDDEKVARDFLNRIDAEVERMTQIVLELLQMSRIEAGSLRLKLEAVDLSVIVRDITERLKLLADRQKLTIAVDTNENLPLVRADGEQVQQVLVNLLHNAIKFTPAGGSVTISTSSDAESVTVGVSDTGIGISREDLPHIFERFYKADKARAGGGTGLGLAIAREIIELHGGRIWVESKEGKGSTFSFSLPLQNK